MSTCLPEKCEGTWNKGKPPPVNISRRWIQRESLGSRVVNILRKRHPLSAKYLLFPAHPGWSPVIYAVLGVNFRFESVIFPAPYGQVRFKSVIFPAPYGQEIY